MQNFLELPRNELETLLKELKRYRSIRKKLGKRAQATFESTRDIRIELAPNTEESGVRSVLKTLWIEEEMVIFTKNPHLSGWARIFISDDLIALSYNDIIQKI